MAKTKRVLNVGGNDRSIALPPPYADYEQLLLDIDPRGSPDIVCDARELAQLEPAQFDAVYCSHNLEHYYRHEVPRVLAGFRHVLKPHGLVHVRVPDIAEVMRLAVENRLDLEDTLYSSEAGPITVLDVIYGLGSEIEATGQAFFAHKTGFTQRSLLRALRAAGFKQSFSRRERLEIDAVAFLADPDAATRAAFGLPAS